MGGSMEIIENRAAWVEHYTRNWLEHYYTTREIDWSRYRYSKNRKVPSGAAIELSKSKILFITSSGAYIKDRQEPFDAANNLGDYEIRIIPGSISFEELDYTHDHYDKTPVRKDHQVLLPLRHLENLVTEGFIGGLTAGFISYMGYQPDITKIADRMIPEILLNIKEQRPDAAFLVPS
jgi:hypothetical protein